MGRPFPAAPAAKKVNSMNNKPQNFTLGEVLVCPPRNEISAGGKKVRLQPKAMAVLDYLAHHYDSVIDNDELIENVWQGRVVTYGSVQKSINLLRTGLAELMGEREIIKHYSKKGYQLQVPPVFVEAPLAPASRWHQHRGRWLALGTAALLVVAGVVYLTVNRHTLLLDKSHRIAFQKSQGYTSEVGHERAGTPHPEGEHLVYIRQSDSASQLLVRDESGQDWVFAESPGVWQHLEWSPSGRQLVAVELTGEDNRPPSADFSAGGAQLYDIHVFWLDLEAERVLEKHRLSQWQGHIGSVAWWDEETLELVGRQGHKAANQRYRYSLDSQRLDILPVLEFVANPLMSRIHQQKTVIASRYQGRIRLDFLAPNQTRFASRSLAARRVHISWIPDGSGVLVYDPDNRELSLVYRDGKWQALELPSWGDAVLTHPRYSASGEALYFTEQRPEADIWLLDSSGESRALTDNSYLNYAARFSTQGERIAYVSVRNNQSQVWLIEQGAERQISRQSLNGSEVHLLWSDTAAELIYAAADQLYRYRLDTGKEELISSNAGDMIPLMLDGEGESLLALRLTGEAYNLWHFHYGTDTERQLTFGAVGSALAHRGAVYFQYAGQRGLWRWQEGDTPLLQVNRELEPNSRLLAVTDTGLYYMTGGQCGESDIYYRDLDGGNWRVHLARDSDRVSTSDFHPERGALYTRCQWPEADIIRWQ